jgi:uncharacterized protein YndB with AHSA1/START domain
MGKISVETTINASPEAIFAYVADVEKHPEWGQHGNAVTKRGAGEPGVGTIYDTINHQFGEQKETVTVTDYAPGKLFGFDATGVLGVAHHTFELTPAGSGTKLTKTMQITKPKFLARLSAPMIAVQQPKALKEDLRRIKAKLEGVPV